MQTRKCQANAYTNRIYTKINFLLPQSLGHIKIGLTRAMIENDLLHRCANLMFGNPHTIFDLVTTHPPISTQSSNFVFRLQPIYFMYFCMCCGNSFELLQQIVGTHLNCLKFEWVSTTYALNIKKIKKNHICIIKNAPHGVLYWSFNKGRPVDSLQVFSSNLEKTQMPCGVIRSNSVILVQIAKKLEVEN